LYKYYKIKYIKKKIQVDRLKERARYTQYVFKHFMLKHSHKLQPSGKHHFSRSSPAMLLPAL
jgi:hypothetical protein